LFRESLQTSFIFKELTKLQGSSEQFAAEYDIQFRVINPLTTKRRLLYLRQFVPRSKHFFSVIKTYHFMLYGAEFAVCSEIKKKHINTMCVGRM
jgi:hypothetical protein